MSTHLTAVLSGLYASEINCGLSSFWDAGWEAWIGDEMNGRKVETTDLSSLDDVARWLHEQALALYPGSDYAKRNEYFTLKRYDWETWSEQIDEWDQETGAPGIIQLGSAIQLWGLFQNRPASVADAAAAFNCDPARVIEAVEEHWWTYLDGPRDDYSRLMIEHDGE